MQLKKINDEEFINLLTEKKEVFYKIAMSYMKNKEDALDVIQEATCKAYMKKNSLRNPQYFNTWFVKIIMNTAMSMLRKNKKYLPLLNPEEASYEGAMNESEYDLMKALDCLQLKYKNIIILKFYEDMTFKEIGKILKKPESTIKTDYYKAIKILKGEIDYGKI